MSTMTVDFQVSGKTLEEIEANADEAAKELANGRTYTIEIGHVHGSWDFSAKSEPATPSSFTAQVAARLDGLPPSFSAPGLEDRGMLR